MIYRKSRPLPATKYQLRNRQRIPLPVTLSKEEQEQNSIRFLLVVPMVLLFFVLFTTPAFAADDPLKVINNTSDFIFACIKAIGYIVIGFGIVQLGLSFKSHDASQRATGLMSLFGGILIAFAKPILDLIVG
ncbi:TrbC/VirB2 family protein [Ruminococcaceae bacterium OttesenSCG-928-A16]|nr:TrbC/VirB2 family protein [Ruminococcaceae bacterium OttesenSCG-928-A16]